MKSFIDAALPVLQTIAFFTILAMIVLWMWDFAKQKMDRAGRIDRTRRPFAGIRINLVPSRPEKEQRPVAAVLMNRSLAERMGTSFFGQLCIVSFVLGAVFTLALAGIRVTRGYIAALLLFCAAGVIVLQLLMARGANAAARILRPTEIPDKKEDADGFDKCLTKAGFSEPPGVAARGTVYIRPYWGTVYVQEGGYWEHQVAFANTILPFQGYGVKTLESHLKLLEMTGKLALSKG